MSSFKPDFIIPGTQKGGTEAATYNLNLHPSVYLPENECNFFNDEFENGLVKYEKLLDIPKNFKGVVGEKSPRYCMSRGTMKKIKKTFPDVKLIFFIREPVRRLLSQYNHYCQEGWTQPNGILSFAQKIELSVSPHTPISRGVYVTQLKNMIQLFGRENIYICISEKCKKNPFIEYNKIFEFLNIDKLDQTEFNTKIHNRAYDVSITQDEQKYLYNFYKPHNEQLFKLLGYEIPAWSEK